MSNCKEFVTGRVGRVDSIVKVIYGNLNFLGCSLIVIIRVQGKVRDMVPQSTHRSYASGVAGRIRRTHICRKETENVTQSHFKLNHLATAGGLGQGREVGMRPGV